VRKTLVARSRKRKKEVYLIRSPVDRRGFLLFVPWDRANLDAVKAFESGVFIFIPAEQVRKYRRGHRYPGLVPVQDIAEKLKKAVKCTEHGEWLYFLPEE